MNKKARIKKLKSKIAKLQEESGDDILMSLREAVQTEDMLNIMQKQLKDLEESEEDEVIAVFTLKADSEEITIEIVNNNPDPSNLIITAESPLSKNLLKSEIGDIVNFRGKDYEIIEIDR